MRKKVIHNYIYRIITVIPLVIGWIYNRLPKATDIKGSTPRTLRQSNWNLAGYRGNLVQHKATYHAGKGGSYD